MISFSGLKYIQTSVVDVNVPQFVIGMVLVVSGMLDVDYPLYTCMADICHVV